MRAPTQRFVRGSGLGRRVRAVRRESRGPEGHRGFHVIAAFFLFLTLVAPLMSAQVAVAAPAPPAPAADGGAPAPPMPKPNQVIVSGDFGDFPLSENQGIWTGSFAISPGSYSFRVVTQGDEQRS